MKKSKLKKIDSLRMIDKLRRPELRKKESVNLKKKSRWVRIHD